jgi:protein gp37
VWLGTTVENQEWAEKRIPYLLAVPAVVRFLSAEPMLGAVDLTRLTLVAPSPPYGPGVWLDALRGHVIGPDDMLEARIGWVICGGESGGGARAMHPEWARWLRDQCIAAGVPFHFKQWGEWVETRAYSTGRAKFRAVTLDGTTRPLDAGWAIEHRGAVSVERAGKKAAGRLLDGREWNDVPTLVASAAAVEK